MFSFSPAHYWPIKRPDGIDAFQMAHRVSLLTASSRFLLSYVETHEGEKTFKGFLDCDLQEALESLEHLPENSEFLNLSVLTVGLVDHEYIYRLHELEEILLPEGFSCGESGEIYKTTCGKLIREPVAEEGGLSTGEKIFEASVHRKRRPFNAAVIA